MADPTHKKRPLILMLIMPGIALVLSGVITVINVGSGTDAFFKHWLWSFAAALPVLPIALLLSGLIERLFSRALGTLSVFARRVAVSLLTAFLIEFAISTVVTWSNLGRTYVFSDQWLAAFLQSLPIGIVIGLTMNFFVKPRFLEGTR